MNNSIQVYISRSDADDQSPDDQSNMTINDHHPDLTDDEDEDDDDNDDEYGNGSSQSTSQGSSVGSSQNSATYATPPTIEQTVQPKLPKTP